MSQINCPTCGAKTNSVVANCEYCGVELRKAGSLQPTEYITAFRNRLEAIERDTAFEDSTDRYEARCNAIAMFTVPNDVSCLLEMLTFCDGNVVGFMEATGETPKWKGKAKAAYEKLRVAAINNPQINEFLKEYSSKYSNEALAKKERSDVLMYVWIFVGIVLLFAAMMAVVKFSGLWAK